MFAALIKLREIERLLRKGRYEEVLALARDPLIRDHRRARVAAERARAALVDAARGASERGELTRAFQGVRAVLREDEDASARSVEKDVRAAWSERERSRHATERALAAAAAAAAAGDLDRAVSTLASATHAEGVEAALGQYRKRAADKAKLLVSLREADGREGFARALVLATGEAARDLLPSERVAFFRRWFERAAAGAAPGELVSALRATAEIQEAGLVALRERAGEGLLDRVAEHLRRGDAASEDDAASWLTAFPLSVGVDPRGLAWLRGVRALRRARELAQLGDERGMAGALSEAEAVLPKGVAFEAVRKALNDRVPSTDDALAAARAAITGGALVRARGLLLDVLDRDPSQPAALDLLAAVEAREAADLETLRKARDLLGLGVEGSLADCRRLLVRLEAERPDLADVPVLLRDVDRRLREARVRVPESIPSGAAGSDPSDPPPVELRPGVPFVLRVEEHGEWFVHPSPRVLIGNSRGGAADLPVLAAISARHAFFERVVTGETIEYRIVPVEGRPVTRNRRPIDTPTVLSHGDVLRFGEVLGCTFLRPVPRNATAVLRLDGDFAVHGCRQIVLFSENGRAGSIVLGPGPIAHLPLPSEADRVEVFRVQEGEEAGALFARGPRGIAVAERGERPQVKIPGRAPLRAGTVRFFTDPAAP